MKGLVILAIIFCFPVGAIPSVLFVPDDFGTIQDAVDAAADGDTIIVRPGTYVENIDFIGKAIAVRSEKGPSITCIDGNQLASVVIFKDMEGPDSILDGFTLRNGNAGFDHFGGGVRCDHASPTITGNVIKENEGTFGGGISCYSSEAVITGNVIADNSSSDGGGICTAPEAAPLIANNIVIRNRATERGAGISISSATSIPVIINNTVADNKGTDYAHGGGLFCSSSFAMITNTIFWNNSAPVGHEIWDQSGNLEVSHCDVKGGWPGTNNIDADPLFVDAVGGDYHLTFDSPCRSAGDRKARYLPEFDIEGDPRTGLFAFPDIGADEFHTHLYVKGKVTLNGTVNGVIIGWPRTNPVVLVSGAGVLPSPQTTPYGDFWLMPPWDHRIHFNPMPDNGVRSINRTVTTLLAPGTEIPFQALVGTELSNLWIVRIE